MIENSSYPNYKMNPKKMVLDISFCLQSKWSLTKKKDIMKF